MGFKKTLNGVYIELNSSDLYGKNLSCEFIEILAQRYAIGDENKSNKELMEFSYNGSAGRGKTTSIWGTAYKLIANTNLILKNIELHSDVLAGEYYNLIKGEALALRALLHFDLFRCSDLFILRIQRQFQSLIIRNFSLMPHHPMLQMAL